MPAKIIVRQAICNSKVVRGKIEGTYVVDIQ
jgi:hypothetical protein